MKFAIAFAMVAIASPATAFEATLSRASSLKAQPVAGVTRDELAPIPGSTIAPPRSVSRYEPVLTRREPLVLGNVPVPTPKPVIGKHCPIIWPS